MGVKSADGIAFSFFAAMANLSLLVRGWRLRPHSYAIVNEFQCVELSRRAGVRLYFEDAPFIIKKSQPTLGLLPPEHEQVIRSLAAPPDAQMRFDAELRICFPYDLAPSTRADRTFVFMTADFNAVPPHFLAANRPLREVHRECAAVEIITPSRWGRAGLLRSGADPGRVHVVPHGVDTMLFAPPTPQARAATRAVIGCRGAGDDDADPDQSDFVFLNVSTMAVNKGLGLLLRAFLLVARQRPRARLFLKGLELGYYSSRKLIDRELATFDRVDADLIGARMHYNGQSLPLGEVARVYQAADCYVSPYYAESFNLPVLEAAACGLPVLCTAGGPTDDFVTDDFSRRIASDLLDAPTPEAPETRTLVPRVDDIAKQMLFAMDDTDWRRRARSAGPRHVAELFTWKHAVDRLLEVLTAVS